MNIFIIFLYLFWLSIISRDKQRSRFSIKKFAKKYNLEGPIAGNFMRVKYDDYVPTAHKQLGL